MQQITDKMGDFCAKKGEGSIFFIFTYLLENLFVSLEKNEPLLWCGGCVDKLC